MATLAQLSGFDPNATFVAMQNGMQVGDDRRKRRDAQTIGQAMRNGDVTVGAQTAYGLGDIETGNSLAKIAMDRQEIQQKAAEAEAKAADRAALGQAVAGVLPGSLAQIAQLNPTVATSIFNAQQGNTIRQQQLADSQRPKLPQGYMWSPDGATAAPIPGVKVGGDKRVSAGALKAKNEAEDANVNYDAALSSLSDAKAILEGGKVLDGYAAGLRGDLAAKLPDWAVPDVIATPEQGLATSEYGRIMSQEAIKSMSETLKGATTDKELAKFEQNMSDPAIPTSIKKNILARMIKQVEDRKALVTRRAQEMMNADLGDSTQAAGSGGQQPYSGETLPNPAVEELTADPSPERRALFDEVFGAGAAEAVLGP